MAIEVREVAIVASGGFSLPPQLKLAAEAKRV